MGQRYLRYAVFMVKFAYAALLSRWFYIAYKGIHKNIAYSSITAQTLDVYVPQTQGSHLVLMYIYGGAWYSGNKELYAMAAKKLLPLDAVIVIPNYTLNPPATYRQQAREVAAALSWTLERIHEYAGDPQRVFIGGQSAGAHLSSLALGNMQWLNEFGHTASEVCGFYGISGPYDIEQLAASYHGHTPLLDRVFEGKTNFANGSPISHLHANFPPSLLIHGDADPVVSYTQSEALHAKLQTLGVPSELKIYKGAAHAGLLFDALMQNPSQLVTDLGRFVNSSLVARHSPLVAHHPSLVTRHSP
jgi:acetyl esterase/lipase